MDFSTSEGLGPSPSQNEYKDFMESLIWKDLELYLNECLEVNRDLLEGIKTFREDTKPEPMNALRGRNWQIRDLISYVNERANYESGRYKT